MIKEKLNQLSKYAPVICFLALEVFGLISFSLGNSVILFGALSFALAILLFLFSFSKITNNYLYKFAFIVFPIILYVILFAFGNYAKAHMQINVNDFSTVELLFASVGLVSMVVVGFILSLNESFKPSHFLIVIYSGIALLVAINLVINLINFGAFHTIIYRNYYMYYAGKRSDVTASEIAYVLEGFKFIEAKISHYTLFPVLLLSSAVMIPYRSYKDNKTLFFVNIGFAVLALLGLMLVPSFLGIVFAIIILLITLFIFLYKKYKFSLEIPKIGLYVVLGFVGVFFVIMLLNTQQFSKGVAQVIASNSLLNRLFNTNPFARAFNPNITNVLCSDRFFGYYANGEAYFVSDLAPLTSSILFDSFMTVGVIGVVLLALFFGFGFNVSKKIVTENDNDKMVKIALISFAVIYLLYSLLGGYGEYAIYHRVVRPTTMSAPFFIVVFVISYLYCWKFTKEENKNEVEL